MNIINSAADMIALRNHFLQLLLRFDDRPFSKRKTFLSVKEPHFLQLLNGHVTDSGVNKISALQNLYQRILTFYEFVMNGLKKLGLLIWIQKRAKQ